MKKVELLAPAGSFQKLKTAYHFGADAVYVGGKELSLRAGAENFDRQELSDAVTYAHSIGKKIYVTVNIYAKNSDLPYAKEYFEYLKEINVDAVIVSDPEAADTVKFLTADFRIAAGFTLKKAERAETNVIRFLKADENFAEKMYVMQ